VSTWNWDLTKDKFRKGDYAAFLQSFGLFPLDPLREKDWSGRGQHVEFQLHQKAELRRILQLEDLLGSTSNAVVESVKRKRILLARKTVRCSRRFTKEMTIQEVKHLEELQHSHMIQLIGTYIMGTDLAILLYPVAEFNLDTFMQSLLDLPIRDCIGEMYISLTTADKEETRLRSKALVGSFRCLANAVKYIHSKIIKHMDIKPQNILVRDVRWSNFPHTSAYKVYIADFGIARSYKSVERSETAGPTLFTRKYAAPEVVDRDKRGLPADIFSLGCVFAEMLSVLAPWDPEDQRQRLDSIRAANRYDDSSYQANIAAVQAWLGGLSADESLYFPVELLCPVISTMINSNPSDRPSAENLAALFGASERCCTDTTDPEPLEAHKEIDGIPTPATGPRAAFRRVLDKIK